MTPENHYQDKKSLRVLQSNGKDTAEDCVAFANASGGKLLIGIEDKEGVPPLNQEVNDEDGPKLKRRINELTINVSVTVTKQTASNKGQYFEVQIARNTQAAASTTDGKYLIRDGKNNRPLRPDELARFITDRSAFNWELQLSNYLASAYDVSILQRFAERIRNSDRVTPFVKEKSDFELCQYYFFEREGKLTNLGLLCIGTREQRATLAAPVVQCIKYDERGEKVRKWVWDDYALPPWELVDAIWKEIPDWQESYELPEGMFRKNVPVYDEVVVRELLSNALVHRPYNQRGDVFINLYPGHLEIHNPGSLPIGVTPDNILHMTIKRNEHLAKVFYGLKLMEREGSGYDRIYEVLLTGGKLPPKIEEPGDRVKISIFKKIIDPYIIDFVTRADQAFQLSQKERICLGLLAQHKSLPVVQLIRELKLESAASLSTWVDRLVNLGIVSTSGRTKGKTYVILPDVLRSLDFKGRTTLGAIQPHRLKELIIEDLRTYKKAAISEIHQRIGSEIPLYVLQRMLKQMIKEGVIKKEGERRWSRYFLSN